MSKPEIFRYADVVWKVPSDPVSKYFYNAKVLAVVEALDRAEDLAFRRAHSHKRPVPTGVAP